MGKLFEHEMHIVFSFVHKVWTDAVLGVALRYLRREMEWSHWPGKENQ